MVGVIASCCSCSDAEFADTSSSKWKLATFKSDFCVTEFLASFLSMAELNYDYGFRVSSASDISLGEFKIDIFLSFCGIVMVRPGPAVSFCFRGALIIEAPLPISGLESPRLGIS